LTGAFYLYRLHSAKLTTPQLQQNFAADWWRRGSAYTGTAADIVGTWECRNCYKCNYPSKWASRRSVDCAKCWMWCYKCNYPSKWASRRSVDCAKCWMWFRRSKRFTAARQWRQPERGPVKSAAAQLLNKLVLQRLLQRHGGLPAERHRSADIQQSVRCNSGVVGKLRNYNSRTHFRVFQLLQQQCGNRRACRLLRFTGFGNCLCSQ